MAVMNNDLHLCWDSIKLLARVKPHGLERAPALGVRAKFLGVTKIIVSYFVFNISR